MPEQERKKTERRKYLSETGTPYEGPLHNSENPFEGWTRNGKSLALGRYISLKMAKSIAREYGLGQKAIDYTFNRAQKLDYFELGGRVVFKNSKGKLDFSKSIVKAEPDLKPVKLEKIATTGTLESIDDIIGDMIKEGEPKEDDEIVDVIPEAEEPKPASKPQYKPEIIKPAPKPQPALKPVPKPAPKPKPGLRK